MVSQKVVIPAQAGIQGLGKALKRLDSRFHGNDGETRLCGFLQNHQF
jgi:hypothetical protein